jgi:hypothetical protein
VDDNVLADRDTGDGMPNTTLKAALSEAEVATAAVSSNNSLNFCDPSRRAYVTLVLNPRCCTIY